MRERPAGRPPELPPDVPPEYAEAYLRGYERAYAEATGLPSALPPPLKVPEPEDGPEDSEPTTGLDRLDQPVEPPVEESTEPWQFEPPEQPEEPEPPPRTWAFEPPGSPAPPEGPEDPGAEEDGADGDPEDGDVDEDERTDTAEQPVIDPYDEPGPVAAGFVLWEGRDERYDEPPDVEGYPRWVMPFLAVCLIVLLFVAAYLLA